MATPTIDSQPAELSTSKNTIAYLVSVPATAGVCFCRIWIEDEMYSGTFREIGLLKARFDMDYQAVFQIQKFLHANLSYELPTAFDNSTEVANSLCKRYIVYFDTVAVPELETLIAQGDIDLSTDSKYVLLAGFAFHHFPTRETMLLPEGKSFLTAKPLSRSITENQYEYLYYLVKADNTEVSLDVTVYYTDGSNQSMAQAAIGTYQKHQVIVIPLGYNARDYNSLDPEKSIAYIRVFLHATSENTLVVKLSPFKPRASYSKEFYYFSTSMGGLETLVTTGKSKQTDQYTRRVAQRYVPYDYQPSFAVTENLETERKPIYKQSIGFKSKAEYRAYMEFLSSEKQYLRSGDTLLPIIITDKKKALLDDDVYIHSYEFTYYIAQPQL